VVHNAFGSGGTDLQRAQALVGAYAAMSDFSNTVLGAGAFSGTGPGSITNQLTSGLGLIGALKAGDELRALEHGIRFVDEVAGGAASQWMAKSAVGGAVVSGKSTTKTIANYVQWMPAMCSKSFKNPTYRCQTATRYTGKRVIRSVDFGGGKWGSRATKG
jgi:hypothetical protein